MRSSSRVNEEETVPEYKVTHAQDVSESRAEEGEENPLTCTPLMSLTVMTEGSKRDTNSVFPPKKQTTGRDPPNWDGLQAERREAWER